jgi:hypothetical protein
MIKWNSMQNNNDIRSDDELLMRFFDATRQDIPDDGFSNRVMRRIPQRARWMNRIWTAVCVALGVTIFLLFDGVGELRVIAGKMAGDALGFLSSIGSTGVTPAVLFGTAAVLGLVWLYNVLSIQR